MTHGTHLSEFSLDFLKNEFFCDSSITFIHIHLFDDILARFQVNGRNNVSCATIQVGHWTQSNSFYYIHNAAAHYYVYFLPIHTRLLFSALYIYNNWRSLSLFRVIHKSFELSFGCIKCLFIVFIQNWLLIPMKLLDVNMSMLWINSVKLLFIYPFGFDSSQLTFLGTKLKVWFAVFTL